jgi:carotenoid cleavage dioxygenase-like enzyme
MPPSTHPSLQTSHDVDIEVRGLVPPALSGRLLGIGPRGVAHSVEVRPGRTASYRGRRIRPDVDVQHVVAFSGTTLALGDGLPAFELSAALDTLRPVDLAGQGRPVAPFPKHDPTTGELHIIAGAVGGTQAHVVVSAGALTRRNRPIVDTPNHINDLALTRDRVVFVAQGFVGIASREGEGRTTWIATGVAAPSPIHAHDVDDTLVLIALTPMLERWTLHPAAGSIEREVLDPTPRRFSYCGNDGVDGAPYLLWSTGNGTIGRHDLAASRHVHHNLRPDVPGDLVFVADATRHSGGDGGWLVGFVHDASRATTELRVIDAADIAGSPIATAPIPRPIPRGLRCTWIPSTQH